MFLVLLLVVVLTAPAAASRITHCIRKLPMVAYANVPTRLNQRPLLALDRPSSMAGYALLAVAVMLHGLLSVVIVDLEVN